MNSSNFPIWCSAELKKRSIDKKIAHQIFKKYENINDYNISHVGNSINGN